MKIIIVNFYIWRKVLSKVVFLIFFYSFLQRQKGQDFKVKINIGVEGVNFSQEGTKYVAESSSSWRLADPAGRG